MYTILLSGHAGFLKQATRALVDAGLRTPVEAFGHGLTDKVDGGTDPTVKFLRLEGEDVDVAARAVESLRWVLRAHHPAIPDASPGSLLVPDEDLVRRIVRDELAKAAG
ncbi:MAG: hypothetical protein ACRDYZ_05535 [Acidimicrobiales bacterium]